MKKLIVFLTILLYITSYGCTGCNSKNESEDRSNFVIVRSLSDNGSPTGLKRSDIIGQWKLTSVNSDEKSAMSRISFFELKADSTAQILYGSKEVEGKWSWNESSKPYKLGRMSMEVYISGDILLHVFKTDNNAHIFQLKLDSLMEGSPLTFENGKYKKL